MTMKHEMATKEQVASTRAFAKQFGLHCAHLYNNKRKSFRMLKFWLMPTADRRNLEYFLKATKIPYEMSTSRKHVVMYTDL
jgi:hypothetical protein